MRKFRVLGMLKFLLGLISSQALSNPSFPSTDQLYQSLKDTQFAAVPFKYDHHFCTESMNAFFRFLELPMAKKKKFKSKLSGKHRRGDLGLVYRQKSHGNDYNDKKVFFHYHPKLRQEHRALIEADPVVRDFMDRADLVWQEVYQALNQTLKRLDKKYPGLRDKIMKTKEPHILVRFLRYDIQTPGNYLAKPHFDAGSMTFAIAESKPGLRMGSGPDDLKLVHHKDKQALFFLAANISQLIDPTPLKPGWHDVIQVGEKPSDNRYERWALVAFIDGHDTTGAPEKLTHKWRISTNLL
jgi:hypothetical protein